MTDYIVLFIYENAAIFYSSVCFLGTLFVVFSVTIYSIYNKSVI